MAGSNSHITILTLNVNSLTAPFQNTQSSKLDKNSRPISVLSLGNISHVQRHIQTQNKGMEEDLPSKWRAKKAGVTILVSDKTDFKPTKIKRDKEGHYIMAGSNSHKTILILNANGLNAPIKRHRLANWIKTQNPLVCCILEIHLTCKDTHRLKIKGWRKIYQANGEQNRQKLQY